ncbi:MAG TPA: hypothetical protein VGL42_17510 [Opitutaceae bacterium]|jgi:hypothetical protein
MSLDGTWDCGLERQYDRTVVVPGLAADPSVPSPGPLWLRRVVELPGGNWKTAVLRLKGAQWTPVVYISGQAASVAAEPDGAWSCILPPTAALGNVVVIEIELRPDPDAPAEASSRDISSDLWDDVTLHFSDSAFLTSLTARGDWAVHSMVVRWSAANCPVNATLSAEILDGDKSVAQSAAVPAAAGAARLMVPSSCVPWTPASPKMYTVRATLRTPDGVLDQIDQPWAWREARPVGDHFELNGRRFDLRGIQVAWHHWLCDPESAELAFDPAWFRQNIVDAVKGYGGNFVDFTDGRPPTAIQAVCDRAGVVSRSQPLAGAVTDFGDIYLDGEGRPSELPAVRAEIIRDLGPQQSSAQRLAFQSHLCAQVAETARLRGAGIIAPLCALSSPGDRYHGFIGGLGAGRRKPVWDALAAVQAPAAALLDFSDVDFLPGATLRVPVVFLNDSAAPADLTAVVTLRSVGDGSLAGQQKLRAKVPAGGRATQFVSLAIPSRVDHWILSCSLPPLMAGGAPRISYRSLRTIAPQPAPALADRIVGVPADEPELKAMLDRIGLKVVAPDDPSANLILLGRRTWDGLTSGGADALAHWRDLLWSARSIVWLDVGSPAKSAKHASVSLPGGVTVFLEPASATERYVHPAKSGSALWFGLPPDALWRWNGQHGAIVPAETLDATGLSSSGFLKLWVARGGEQFQIRVRPYYAYSLQGLYAFSNTPHDADAAQSLRDRLRRIAHDQPVLNSVLDFQAPVVETNLSAGFREALKAGASSIVPLMTAGGDLSRTPVLEIGYSPGRGVLILSQLETAGRLNPGARFDPGAVQIVLNLLGVALDDYSPVAP